MKLVLDAGSPVPLYHQIAEAISYRIATGGISPGEKLPPVREGATTWGVNMHTVRRAYTELAQRGLVETRGALGTRVLRAAPGRRNEARGRKVDTFLKRVLREAHERHGLTPHALAHLLTNWSATTTTGTDVVHVVECSETQCIDHTREIEASWDVDARPWCLSREGEPPAGPVVATYFHYNEVRRRWPHRLHEIRFAAIHLDSKLPSRVRPRVRKGKRMTLTLCEFDEPMALNIASDLSILFPDSSYRIERRVVERANELLKPSKDRSPVLLSPRVWDALTPEETAHPRAFKVFYAFTPEELDAIGEHFGWRRRATRLRETSDAIDSPAAQARVLRRANYR